MTTSPHDKAPDMMSIKINFDDGTFAQLSVPHAELAKLNSAERDGVIDSAALVMRGVMGCTTPKQEDYERVMSIEGASLVLPEGHGPIEIQTLIGEQLLTGVQADLEKY